MIAILGLTNSKPLVREAHSDEVELLSDILVRAFSEYEGRLDPPSGVHSESVTSLADKLKEGGALNCEAGGGAVGCIFYGPRAGYLYVGRLAVLPERLQRSRHSHDDRYPESRPDCPKAGRAGCGHWHGRWSSADPWL